MNVNINGVAQNRVGNEVAILEAQDLHTTLMKILQGAPDIRSIARQRLQENNVGLNIDAVYINAGDGAQGQESRPSGSIVDVFLYFLNGRGSPDYVGGEDDVYSRANTRDTRYKVPGLSIEKVGDIIDKALSRLDHGLRTALDIHWDTIAADKGNDGAQLTHKEIFRQGYAKLLNNELLLSVNANLLEDHQARRTAELLATEDGLGVYRILKRNGQAEAFQTASFVVDNALLGNSEIIPNNDSYGWTLYTPDHGFEYFVKSIDLHSAVCERLSAAKDQITYPALKREVYSFCVESLLKEQRSMVTQLMHQRNVEGKSVGQALVTNQRMAALTAQLGKRFEILQAAIRRTEWPAWLKSAQAPIQQRYQDLEYSRDQYRIEYKAIFDRYLSLKAYTLRVFADWTQSALGEQLNPDLLTVHSVYQIKVGGRTIVQEESKTLTEFIIAGLHDVGYRVQFRIEGAPGSSGLTAEKLETWLHNRDLRKDYAAEIPRSVPEDFHQACADDLHAKMQLALFVAQHSGVLNQSQVALIERGMKGDPGVLIRGVKIENSLTPLKDVLVFNLKSSGESLAFVKTPRGDFQFLGSATNVNRWLKENMASDRRYAESLIRAADLPAATVLETGKDGSLLYRYLLDDNRRVELGLAPGAPLQSYAGLIYQAEVAMCKNVAPIGFYYAQNSERQKYFRLNAELQALSTVETKENEIPSLEAFARTRIKMEVESLLRDAGHTVKIDPDDIIVQTDTFTKSLTSMLLEGLKFDVPEERLRVPGGNPKYYFRSGRPNYSALDIRHISNWSKTAWLADKYSQALKSDYLDSGHSSYGFKRDVHARKIRCEMLVDAFSQYFDGRMSADLFKGVQRVIDGLKEAPGPKGAPIIKHEEGLYDFNISSLRIVEGVYIFRVSLLGSLVDHLYTPNAPDRLAYRPIGDFVGSIRYRYGPFRNYYAQRVMIDDKKVVNDYFDKLVATVDTPPALKPEGKYRISNLGGFHNERIKRILSDIDASTTSINEFIAGLIYEKVLLVASIISIAIPPVGVLVTGIQLAKSIYDSSKAYRRGEYEEALGHGKDALIALISLGKSFGGTGATAVTRVQKSLFALGKDAKTVAGWVTQASGLDSPDKLLVDFIQQLMEENPADTRQVYVR